MSTIGDVLGSLRADSPWLLVLVPVVLAAASGAWRRASGTLQRFGGRLGAVEALVASERTRRRQVEVELLRLGVPLPYWPDDPGELRELTIANRRGREHDDDEDRDDEQPPVTRQAPAVPPPPGRAARHADSR